MTENTSLGKNTHVDESQTSLFWQQPFYRRTATVNKHSPTGWRELPHADLQKSDAVDLDKQCGIMWGPRCNEFPWGPEASIDMPTRS